jgi:hypothetical protein
VVGVQFGPDPVQHSVSWLVSSLGPTLFSVRCHGWCPVGARSWDHAFPHPESPCPHRQQRAPPKSNLPSPNRPTKNTNTFRSGLIRRQPNQPASQPTFRSGLSIYTGSTRFRHTLPAACFVCRSVDASMENKHQGQQALSAFGVKPVSQC